MLVIPSGDVIVSQVFFACSRLLWLVTLSRCFSLHVCVPGFVYRFTGLKSRRACAFEGVNLVRFSPLESSCFLSLRFLLV
jgi:hypothetical protein